MFIERYLYKSISKGEQNLKRDANIIVSPLADYIFVPLATRLNRYSDIVLSRVETSRNVIHGSISLPKDFFNVLTLSDNEGQIFVSCLFQKHETNDDENSIYRFYDTEKQELFSVVKALNRKVVSTVQQIPRLSSPICCCSSPIINGLHFFVSLPNIASTNTNITTGCYVHALLVYCKDSSETPQVHFSDIIRLDRGDCKITTLVCHPSKPLLTVCFSTGSVEMYSYHQLHLNLLKKTGTNSDNDNVEGGPIEVDEDAENEEEKSSRNHISSSSTTAVTAIQLQRLCILSPPSSTAVVATNVSVGHRFVAIVWDGQITTLYDLWPIVKSNVSPPSPAALSAVSVFQFNKQQKNGTSDDRLGSLCFHSHAPLLFQLRRLRGILLLYTFDLRQSLLSPLGLHQIPGEGKALHNLQGRLQCTKSSGHLILTLDQGSVLSLELCEHWLMTKGLRAFVDPLLSPTQLPDAYRFDDCSNQDIPRDIKLLHRSLTSFAVRMEYANSEKGDDLLYHIYEVRWLECMLKPDKEKKDGVEKSTLVGSFSSLMKKDGGRHEALTWLRLKDEDYLAIEGAFAEKLLFYPSGSYHLSPSSSLVSQLSEGVTESWGLLNGVLFHRTGHPLACVLVFHMINNVASTTTPDSYSPPVVQYCCTIFKAALFLSLSTANFLRKEKGDLPTTGLQNAMLCLSSCGRRLSLLSSEANVATIGVDTAKLPNSTMSEYFSWQLPDEMDFLWTAEIERDSGPLSTAVYVVLSSKQKDSSGAILFHSCALGIEISPILNTFALQPGENLLDVKSNLPLLAVRSTERVLLFQLHVDRLQVVGTVSYHSLSIRDAALSLTWVGSAILFARSSGRIDFLHPAPAVPPRSGVQTIAARRKDSLRREIADRILGVKSFGYINNKNNGVGHLCSLPLPSFMLCSAVRVVGALPDRLLLSYLSFADTTSLPLPAVSTRPCNYLEPLVYSTFPKSDSLMKLCLPYLSLTWSQVQQLPSPWGTSVTVPSSQHSRAICRAVVMSSQHPEITFSPMAQLLVGYNPNLAGGSSFARLGWLAPPVRALVVVPSGHLNRSAVQQLFSGRSDQSSAFQGFFTSESEERGDASIAPLSLPHSSSFLSNQIAAVARGLLRKGDITYAKKLALLTRSGRPELDTYESSRGPYSFIRIKDLGRSGRIRFMQPSSQVIEGSSDEGESVKSAARYSELEQQLLQSFAQRGGGFGIPLLPGKEVLSMDLLEDFMGRNLILETVPHPNNLSIGASTGKSSNGQDNAKMSVPATSMGDDQASQTLTIPSTWTSDVGQGRDMDKVVGYWRFSDSVFPDEEGFSSFCPLIDYRCACVLTDLSKYAGGLEVLQSIKDSTCAVSLEVSSHPTLEAGEKHDTTKLLYDAVFSDSVLGLRCAVPRGSQLDLGLYHRDQNRARLTFEIAVAFKKSSVPAATAGAKYILLQRRIGLGEGRDDTCMWTLFLDERGTLFFSFGMNVDDETDGKDTVSVSGILKYPLLEQAEEEIWHHIAFTLDSSRSRWTAQPSEEGGRVLNYLDPVSVSLYIDGERACEPALVHPPMRRIKSDTEEEKNLGIVAAEDDLSLLGQGDRSLLLVGPGLGAGWRITEVRAWSDIRSEVELTQQRDLCLPLAVKRRRMQLRLQGQVGNTRKIFGSFRDPNPSTLSLSSSGQPNSDLSITIKNEYDPSSNPVKATNLLLPPQKVGKLSLPLAMPPPSTGGVRNSLPPPNSAVNSDQSDTASSSGSGLSSAARNRLMRRQANPPSSTDSLPTASIAPISKSITAKAPEDDIGQTFSWLFSYLGGRFCSDDIVRAANKTKLFDPGSGSFAVALSAAGHPEQVTNTAVQEGEDKEVLLFFELVRWAEAKAQNSTTPHILRLTYPSRVKPGSGYPSASMILWGGSGCPANVLRAALYDQRYIRVLDFQLPADLKLADPLLLSAATKVCELPMKSTPLAFWLFINSTLILLVTHQAGFTLRLHPSPSTASTSSAASQNLLKPIKILDRCDIPPSTNWEDRSVLDLAVFAGGWTLLVTASQPATKEKPVDEMVSNTISLYHARSGTSVSLSALAACFSAAEKVMEKESVTVWLLMKMDNGKEGSCLRLGKVRFPLDAFSLTGGGSVPTSTSAYQQPWAPDEILSKGETLKTIDLALQLHSAGIGVYFLLSAPAGRGDWVIIVSANGHFVRCIFNGGDDERSSSKTGSVPGLSPDDSVQAVRLEEPDFLLIITRNGMLIKIQITNN